MFDLNRLGVVDFQEDFGPSHKDSGLSEFSDHASRTVSEWQLGPSPN